VETFGVSLLKTKDIPAPDLSNCEGWAKLKALTKQTADGMKVHSFQTVIGDLATIVKNRIQPADKTLAVFDMLTQPTVIQQRALDLLGVTLRP